MNCRARPGRPAALARELVLLVRAPLNGGCSSRPTRSPAPAPDRGAAGVSPVADRFLRLLRKRLEGRVLVRVECPGVERSVTFAFRLRAAHPPILLLIAELMGKHSNLILLEIATGLVIDSLQHVAPPMSRVRTVLAGTPLHAATPRVGCLDVLERAAFARSGARPAEIPRRSFRRVLGLGSGMLALASATRGWHRDFRTTPGPRARCAARCAGLSTAAPAGRSSIRSAGCCSAAVPGWEAEAQVSTSSMSEAAAAFYAQRIGGAPASGARRVEPRTGPGSEAAGGRGSAAARGGCRRRRGGFSPGARGASGRGDYGAEGCSCVRIRRPAHRRQPGGAPRPGARTASERGGAVSTRAQDRRRAALAAEKLPAIVARADCSRRNWHSSRSCRWRRLSSDGRPRSPCRESRRRSRLRQQGRRSLPPASGSTVLRRLAYSCRQKRAGNDQLTGRIAGPEDFWFHVRDYPGAHVVLKGAARSRRRKRFGRGRGGGLAQRRAAERLSTWPTQGEKTCAR